MSSCRRVCSPRLSAGLNTLFHRVKTQTICCGCSSVYRTHATAPKQNPDSGSEDKPRLRAIDLARKIQQENQKKPKEDEPPISSQKKRVMDLKQFSQKLQKVHPNVLAKHLTQTVLYQDKYVVITNKPYGVPLRNDSGLTSSVESVLPVLARMLEGVKVRSDAQLLPTLALEKEATGALLLARSEGVVEHLMELNRNNLLQRKFWVIAVGVPVPAEGMIDIPLIEREVTGAQPHYKMALSPLYRMNEEGDVTKVRGHRQAIPAMTKYKVLESGNGCSLVELQPLTGVKHQLRVHMALGLSCPILGDHKYSNWSKLAPQKLPDRVLEKLGLEQSKIRHLPLHLHSKLLAIPKTDESEIRVSCHPPKFFKQTMSRLHLVIPEEKNNR